MATPPLFWIPWLTGVLHSFQKQEKKNPQTSITLSILTTTSVFSVLRSYGNEFWYKPEHQKMLPTTLTRPGFILASLTGSVVMQGSVFCLGHLMAKQAAPLLE